MNSKTIQHYVSDMKKTKWTVSTKKTITWKEGTNCIINDIGIFEDSPAFGFVISLKNHQFSKNLVSNIWVPTPNTSNKFKYI